MDAFSSAIGLDINFHKSTFVSLHVDSDEAEQMEAILGCGISTFPQTYLMLPLSPHKLRVSGFQSLLNSFYRCLAGWKARLLSSEGAHHFGLCGFGQLANILHVVPPPPQDCHRSP